MHDDDNDDNKPHFYGFFTSHLLQSHLLLGNFESDHSQFNGSRESLKTVFVTPPCSATDKENVFINYGLHVLFGDLVWSSVVIIGNIKQ